MVAKKSVNSTEKVNTATLASPPKKSQKVKIFVSVYRVNDKIISAYGIPTVDAPVIHRLSKNKLKVEDLFVFTTQIKNHLPFCKMDSYNSVVEQTLNEKATEIVLPETRANKLQNIGTLVHEILNIEIELLS